MDWNKTKTIFIIVFSILNIFLFSLYLNRYNEAQDIEVRIDTPIEERFLLDNIKVPKMESDIQGASYVTGNLHTFNAEELANLANQKVEVENGYQLTSTFDKPLPITQENKLEKVIDENIIRGNTYGLWKIDEESHSATFFQKVNNRLVYNNKYAKLIVYFNDKQEIVSYEQSLLDNLEDYYESKSLLSSMQAIKVLYKRGLLKPDSIVKEVNLGYSTLAQLEGTQVFAPTWHIWVKLSDETSEEYFVNAVEGKIIEIPKETEQTVVK